MLNYDNAGTRELIDHCVRTSKVMVNPLIDWEDDDVWEFIKREKIPYCKLYDEGLKRLGCIGCPMGNKSQQVWQFNRWPVYRKMYIRAFDEMVKAREQAGLQNASGWVDGESVMRWWLGDLKTVDKNQITMDLEGEE